MAKINTLNYQTVAAWNGSQDLFVVEQPDGTKVATPAMVKQFIEAGDFEATGEVKDGHGNILKDMAKSADMATALEGKQDTLTFDDAPTASSNNSVKSGGIYAALDNIIKVVEKNIKLSTSGHASPIRSAAGVYYEALVNYATLGVTKDKILSVEIINWDGITHSFNLYLGGNTISAMSDSTNSIFYGGGSFVDLRVVYRG